jgi:hypothetical protein
MTTIDEIYTAINPLPAMLAAKGKAKPEAEFEVEANAGMWLRLMYLKPHSSNDWDKEYHSFQGSTFDEALGKAVAFIKELPSAEQAKLHEFMGALGKLIDAGRADGISVDYMNPLLDTMKRLSENVITYKPGLSHIPQESRDDG